jgi:NAD(P)H-hydrate repair Nnr-like enzyme with NAD(P)H-hydrate dehydratase domain
MIAGLLAQGYSLFDAASQAVEHHAKTADAICHHRNMNSLLPSDILEAL